MWQRILVIASRFLDSFLYQVWRWGAAYVNRSGDREPYLGRRDVLVPGLQPAAVSAYRGLLTQGHSEIDAVPQTSGNQQNICVFFASHANLNPFKFADSNI